MVKYWAATALVSLGFGVGCVVGATISTFYAPLLIVAVLTAAFVTVASALRAAK